MNEWLLIFMSGLAVAAAAFALTFALAFLFTLFLKRNPD